MDTFKIVAVNRHRLTIDGEGVTTLVGLYGCPLDCKYCLNKELLHTNKYDEVTPELLWDKLKIDYCYFVATGGGVTFGGGEPLLQSKVIRKFKEILPDNVNINIETSLNVERQNLDDVIDIVDELIIDIKSFMPGIYKEYTGFYNMNTIKNLRYLCSKNLQHKCKIRVPNIPYFTTKRDIEQTLVIVKQMGFKNIETFDYIVKQKGNNYGTD